MSAAASAGLGAQYRPYETDSGSESETETVGSDSLSDSDEEIDRGRISHEGRGAAHDEWQLAARRWITSQHLTSGPAERVLPGRSLAQPLPPPASALDLPIELRANDIKRHIINIDSQFREVPAMSTASNFYFRLVAPVRNVMRIRVTSVEAPNNYYIFSAARRNIYLSVTVGTNTNLITLAEGNYSATEMATALQAALVAAFGAGTFTVTFNMVTGKFTITNATTAFSINTTPSGGVYWYDRSFAWGLGANLGFSKGVTSSTPGTGVTHVAISDSCANFAGDYYLLLCVNDFECVRQTVATTDSTGLVQVNEIKALAKLVLREPKNYVAFDNYASQHIKEVVFNAPRDLERLHVRLLDPYGEPVPLCSSQFSFSLEVLEIQNPTLFDTVRDAIMVRYV